MNNDFTLYGVIDKSTGKLVSDITNPRHKFWERKKSAETAVNRYKSPYHNNIYKHKQEDLDVVEIECKVKTK